MVSSDRPLFRVMAAALATMCVAFCAPAQENAADAETEVFRVGAETVPCVGVGPMRCLLVNDQFFYDDIEGYTHVEGLAAEICVVRSLRPAPVPADASAYVYKRVPCSDGQE